MHKANVLLLCTSLLPMLSLGCDVDGTSAETSFRSGGPDDPIIPIPIPICGDLEIAYAFDEAAGTAMVDGSGCGNHGTYFGSIALDAAECPTGTRCRELDGASDYAEEDSFVDLPVSSTEKVTIAAWIFIDDFQSGLDVIFQSDCWINAAICGSTRNGFGLYLDDSLVGQDHRVLSIRVGDGGGSIDTDTTFFKAQPELEVGTWHHVAAVLDFGNEPQPNASWARIYIDGLPVAVDQTCQGGTYGGCALHSRTSGHPGRVGDDFRNHFFAGVIDDLQIWTTVLVDEAQVLCEEAGGTFALGACTRGEICVGDRDEDHDDLSDCMDPDCKGHPACEG